MSSAATTLAVVGVVLGALFVVVGVLGAIRRLPRNRWVGIRTPLTMRSDAAFAVAHAAAAPGLLGAGGVGVLAGVLAVGAGDTTGVVFGVVGVLAALLLTGVAASVGLRAAARVSPDTDDACRSAGGAASCGSCVLQGGCAGVATTVTSDRHAAPR